MLTHENTLSDAIIPNFSRMSASISTFVLAMVVVFSGGCSSPPTDLGRIAPADTLVFLESTDLGAALGAVTGSDEFRSAAERVPDFSAVRDLRVGVFVTGLDVSEEEADDGGELRLRPRFVAVAESPSWFWKPGSFVDGPLAAFVKGSYGGDFERDTFDEIDGEVSVWKSGDGRSVFIAVRDDLVLFSNNREAMQGVLATRRGERDNMSGNSALQRIRDGDALASGYISQAGVAQLSNFVGISAAISTTDDDDGRSFIARIVPDLVRSNVREVLWTARLTPDGIEDRYDIVLADKVSEEMAVAAQPVTRTADDLIDLIPAAAVTITRYDIASPSIAWTTLLRNLSDSTDVLNGTVLTRAADAVFSPYGILSAGAITPAIASPAFTASLDDSGEQVVAFLKIRDESAVRNVVAVDLQKPAEMFGDFAVWFSEDDDFAYAKKGDLAIVGDADAVRFVLGSSKTGSLRQVPGFDGFAERRGASVTMGIDSESLAQIAGALSIKLKSGAPPTSRYIVSTEFNQRGILRTTVSGSGLLGNLVSQFSAG